MKYRIIKYNDEFIPQRKTFWFFTDSWENFPNKDGYSEHFETLDYAIRFIENHKKLTKDNGKIVWRG